VPAFPRLSMPGKTSAADVAMQDLTPG
jgi:hypothetical protein